MLGQGLFHLLFAIFNRRWNFNVCIVNINSKTLPPLVEETKLVICYPGVRGETNSVLQTLRLKKTTEWDQGETYLRLAKLAFIEAVNCAIFVVWLQCQGGHTSCTLMPILPTLNVSKYGISQLNSTKKLYTDIKNLITAFVEDINITTWVRKWKTNKKSLEFNSTCFSSYN